MEKLINTLLEKENRSMEIKQEYIVKKLDKTTKIDIDIMILDLQQDDKLYKGVAMIKGLTFPIPEENDIILVKKIYLKYSQEFQLKLFIEGEIFGFKIRPKDIKDIKDTYSFEYINIFQTLSSISNISVTPSYSTIFKIIDINKNEVALKSISDLKLYHLKLEENRTKILKSDEFLWIQYYQLQEDKILLNKLSTLEILNEEQLLIILETLPFENVSLYHIIDINDNNIMLINSNGKLFELKQNKYFVDTYNIDFCSTILVSNYFRGENKIELNELSFVYKFKQESYYFEKVLVNSYAVLEITFLDFNGNQNFYDRLYCGDQYDSQEENENIIKQEEEENEEELDELNVKEIEKKISEKEKREKRKEIKRLSRVISNQKEYIVLSSNVRKKYEYFPYQIGLYNSEKLEENEELLIFFTIFVYPGLINKINAFINIKCPKTYFYEFFYYNIDKDLGIIEKSLIIEGKEYKINNTDSFGSRNRKRICVLNIPYQKTEVPEEELNTNSIQIGELIKDDINKIIGIWDISEDYFYEENMNLFFDDYYSEFGDVYDVITKKTKNYQKMIIFLNEKIELFKSKKLNDDFTMTYNFEDRMTLSRFKARIGLIICQFMSQYKKYLIDIIYEISKLYLYIRDQKLKYSEIIRITVYTLIENIAHMKDANIDLKFISQLEDDSPYKIAFEFNKEQINYLDEFSPLFQAYLQMDSYKSYNYINQRESHTFSMELLFMMRYQLLTAYENFFFIKRKYDIEYASLDINTGITIINEKTIFGPKYNENKVIKNNKIAKDYAMPISINFLHEKSGHYKYMIKNHQLIPPLIYYKGLKIKLEVAYKEECLIGESGEIIEDFICDDKSIINELLTNFIYGELLKKEYFGQKNFKNLIKAIKEKLKKSGNESSNPENNKKDNIHNKKPGKLKYPIFKEHNDIQFDFENYKKFIQMSSEERKAKLNKIWNYRKKQWAEKKRLVKKIIKK